MTIFKDFSYVYNNAENYCLNEYKNQIKLKLLKFFNILSYIYIIIKL